MTHQRETIEKFGLVRREESHYLDEYIFLVPFAGPMTEESEWISCQIRRPSPDEDLLGLHQYAINRSKNTYVVFTAFLLSPRGFQGRKTEMRLWQMIVANWIDAGHAPDPLRYLGANFIINNEARDAMEMEWHYQIDNGQHDFGTPHQRMLTMKRDKSFKTWGDNTFVRSGLRVAESLSTPGKTLTLDKAHLVQFPESEKEFEAEWSLVLEFKNGDPGQENYRDTLIRSLLPMITDNLEVEERGRRRRERQRKSIRLDGSEED